MPSSSGRQPTASYPKVALSALIRGLRVEARLMVTLAGLILLGAIADSTFPVVIASIAARLFDHSASDVRLFGVVLVVTAIIGVIVDQLCVTVSERFSRRVGVHLRTHLAQLEAEFRASNTTSARSMSIGSACSVTSPTRWNCGTPRFFQTAGTLLRLAFIAVVVAVSVPTALLLLPVLLLPSGAAIWRSGVAMRAERVTEKDRRRANYAIELASNVAYVKDVRILGLQDRIRRDYRSFHRTWYVRQRDTRLGTILTESCCWLLCGVGLLVVLIANARSSAATNLVIVAIGCTQIAAFMSATAGEAAYLRQWTDAAASLSGSRDCKRSNTQHQPGPRQPHLPRRQFKPLHCPSILCHFAIQAPSPTAYDT